MAEKARAHCVRGARLPLAAVAARGRHGLAAGAFMGAQQSAAIARARALIGFNIGGCEVAREDPVGRRDLSR